MKLHAFVISWHGRHRAALRIVQNLAGTVEHLTVLHSSADGTGHAQATPDGAEWLDVDNAWYYGRKFEHCLHLHRGEVMLQIQADAEHHDWQAVVRRCRETFAAHAELGVWAPEVDFTPFPLQETRVRSLPGGHWHQVVQTDGIVWALAPRVLARLRQLDYACNNLGWGMDWAAIAHAHAHGLLVLRDTALTITHPRGSGYDPKVATAQKAAFLAQLTAQEQAQLVLLQNHLRGQRSLPTRVLLEQLLGKLREAWARNLRRMAGRRR